MKMRDCPSGCGTVDMYASAICEMWKKQLKTLLNCVTTDTRNCATIDALSTICGDSYIDVTPDMVSVAIGKLKCGKACVAVAAYLLSITFMRTAD